MWRLMNPDHRLKYWSIQASMDSGKNLYRSPRINTRSRLKARRSVISLAVKKSSLRCGLRWVLPFALPLKSDILTLYYVPGYVAWITFFGFLSVRHSQKGDGVRAA
jgi:hypothetical protein